MRRIVGVKDLLADAVIETTNLVEETHAATAGKVFRVLEENSLTATPAQGVRALHNAAARGIYASIRATTEGVASLMGAGLALYASSSPFGQESDSVGGAAAPTMSRWFDHVQSGVNGLYGDHLHRRSNPLDLGMSLRQAGRVVRLERDTLASTFPTASGRLCVFIHGLGVNESSWNIAAKQFYGDASVNFGAQLQAECGWTPLYVRYNTGRHISENGRLLSQLLAQICAEYPTAVEEVALVGHSMGGLAARSAAHYGALHNEPWVQRLRHVVCIGSPHLGAPLEKATNILSSLLRAWNAAGTRVPARFLDGRSAGVKDLRFGYTLDEEWQGQDPDAFLSDNRQDVTFVEGVRYAFIAATISQNTSGPIGVLLGDVLVRVPSASGQGHHAMQRIPFHAGHVFGGISHLHLANHPDVYRALRQILI